MKRTLRGRLYPHRRGERLLDDACAPDGFRHARRRRHATCDERRRLCRHAGPAPRPWHQSTVSRLLPKKLMCRPRYGVRRERYAAVSMANSEHIRAKSSSFALFCHGKPSKIAMSLSFAPCRRPLYGRLEIATCGFAKTTSAAGSRRSDIPRQMSTKLDDIAKNAASLWQTARGAHPDRAERQTPAKPARQTCSAWRAISASSSSVSVNHSSSAAASRCLSLACSATASEEASSLM